MDRSISSHNMLRRLLQVQHDRKNDQPQVHKREFDVDVVIRELERDDTYESDNELDRDDTYESDEELDDTETPESTEWAPGFGIPSRDANVGVKSYRPRDPEFWIAGREESDEATTHSRDWNSYDQEDDFAETENIAFIDTEPTNALDDSDLLTIS